MASPHHDHGHHGQEHGHAGLIEGTDAHTAVAAIKLRLAKTHGIGHATVEPECGDCADIARSWLH